MAEDRSLDDFAPGADPDGPSESTDSDEPNDRADADSDSPSDDATPVEAAADDPDDGAGDVEPAAATSTWHTEGADCDQCGERVQRRWRDGDEFVCADCAPW